MASFGDPSITAVFLGDATASSEPPRVYGTLDAAQAAGRTATFALLDADLSGDVGRALKMACAVRFPEDADDAFVRAEGFCALALLRMLEAHAALLERRQDTPERLAWAVERQVAALDTIPAPEGLVAVRAGLGYCRRVVQDQSRPRRVRL